MNESMSKEKLYELRPDFKEYNVHPYKLTIYKDGNVLVPYYWWNNMSTKSNKCEKMDFIENIMIGYCVFKRIDGVLHGKTFGKDEFSPNEVYVNRTPYDKSHVKTHEGCFVVKTSKMNPDIKFKPNPNDSGSLVYFEEVK